MIMTLSLAGAGRAWEELRAERAQPHALLRQLRPACLRQTDSQRSRGLQPILNLMTQHGCPLHATAVACGYLRSRCLR